MAAEVPADDVSGTDVIVIRAGHVFAHQVPAPLCVRAVCVVGTTHHRALPGHLTFTETAARCRASGRVLLSASARLTLRQNARGVVEGVGAVLGATSGVAHANRSEPVIRARPAAHCRAGAVFGAQTARTVVRNTLAPGGPVAIHRTAGWFARLRRVGIPLLVCATDVVTARPGVHTSAGPLTRISTFRSARTPWTEVHGDTRAGARGGGGADRGRCRRRRRGARSRGCRLRGGG